ncbi:MAG: hypothetical protein IPL46_19005 [Saprospiraceae bacterium]|nr:hypothetical protein [Saprospiraceae bacterium]
MMKRGRFIGHSRDTSLGLMTLTNGFVSRSAEGKKHLLKPDMLRYLYDLVHFKYPWLDRVPKINRSFTPDDFRIPSKKSDVGKMIFTEIGAAPEFAMQEALW